MVRAFSFESCFVRVVGGSCHCSSRSHRSSVAPAVPACPTCLFGLQRHPAAPGSLDSSSDNWLSWSIFALVLTFFTVDDSVVEVSSASHLSRRESRARRLTCVGATALQTQWAWMLRALARTPYPRRGRRIRLDDKGEPPSDDSHAGW